MATRKHFPKREPQDLIGKLFDRIVLDNGCWSWTSRIEKSGYGRFKIYGGKDYRVHQLVYEVLIGPVPDGLVLDHLCRNTLCVNPDHLEPVTQRENTLRGIGPAAVNSKKKYCARGGHSLSGDNLYVDPRGRRECKECRRQAYKRYTLKEKMGV